MHVTEAMAETVPTRHKRWFIPRKGNNIKGKYIQRYFDWKNDKEQKPLPEPPEDAG